MKFLRDSRLSFLMKLCALTPGIDIPDMDGVCTITDENTRLREELDFLKGE